MTHPLFLMILFPKNVTFLTNNNNPTYFIIL